FEIDRAATKIRMVKRVGGRVRFEVAGVHSGRPIPPFLQGDMPASSPDDPSSVPPGKSSWVAGRSIRSTIVDRNGVDVVVVEGDVSDPFTEQRQVDRIEVGVIQ